MSDPTTDCNDREDRLRPEPTEPGHDDLTSAFDIRLDREFGKLTQTAADMGLAISEETDFVADAPVSLGHRGRYRVEHELARGGMGIVLQCFDIQLKRPVAVKLLRANYASVVQMRRRFIHEARITGKLQHPGIVRVYEVGISEDDRPFFAMELIAGKSLAELFAGRQVAYEEIGKRLKAFEHVCQALAYAHSQGVIHLDLKPSNVMVGEFGEVRLLDWGLSKRMQRREPNEVFPHGSAAAIVPIRHRVRGTPSYMAPEQARGETLDARADVFGLGAILCELLTGHPPFQASGYHETYRLAVAGTLEPARQRLENCGSDTVLIRLAKACIESEPSLRPAGAIEVAQQVTAYLEVAVQQAESDLSRFFELSLDMFCIAGMDGYFRRINDNFFRVLGYSPQELVSRPFLDFVHPDDRQATLDVMGCLSNGQPVVQFRNRYRSLGGEYRCLEWTAKSIPEESIIFAVARDVTGRTSLGAES